jgi:hypothetical protein
MFNVQAVPTWQVENDKVWDETDADDQDVDEPAPEVVVNGARISQPKYEDVPSYSCRPLLLLFNRINVGVTVKLL